MDDTEQLPDEIGQADEMEEQLDRENNANSFQKWTYSEYNKVEKEYFYG